jgi:hypothetical protein
LVTVSTINYSVLRPRDTVRPFPLGFVSEEARMANSTNPSIVFCHGPWADASCFRKQIPVWQAEKTSEGRSFSPSHKFLAGTPRQRVMALIRGS